MRCRVPHFLGDRVVDADVFLAETEFQRQVLRRRQRHGAEGWDAWFVTPEDLILLKLIANRAKDQIDIADILFIQGCLDEQYLKAWAQELGVTERLETAFKHRIL